ncbi:MAG: DUF4325 domain-containing protein [Bryobacterales bacterium]|nr:DUF4325 domain-containing protein [Bryobacterales bacterium]
MSQSVELPERFSFINQQLVTFDDVLCWFDWNFEPDDPMVVDISKCSQSNYQALALLVLYIWKVKATGATVDLHKEGSGQQSAWTMFKTMGAVGWSQVLFSERKNFEGGKYKPLIALRNSTDFNRVKEALDQFSEDFHLEYSKILHYVTAEILYNTLEHGQSWVKDRKGKDFRIPSLVQLSWYETRNEISVIIADLGIGIRKHLSRAYPSIESDVDALLLAIRPNISGTFGQTNPYTQQNNAGVGLFFSSQIMQKLRGDMYVVSGNGLLHISPKDITTRTLECSWPGTIVYLKIDLQKSDSAFKLDAMLAETRKAAAEELRNRESAAKEESFYLSIYNYFGRYAENKMEAISYKDKHLVPAAEAGKTLVLDFVDVEMSTHSFLSALLKGPIGAYVAAGLNPYKKIKLRNPTNDIRETVEYILESLT